MLEIYDVLTCFGKPWSYTDILAVKWLRHRQNDPKEGQWCTVYNITYNDDHKHTYVDESMWPLEFRFKEHTKLDKPTGVGEHCLNTGHSVSITNTKVLERELDWDRRKVKKAIHIRQRRGTKATSYHPCTTWSFRRCLSHFTAGSSVCDQGLPKQVETS